MAFAKLFETDQYGQILVKRDENDDGEAEVRFFFEPPGLGVCSVAMGFGDNWDDADKVLEKADDASAAAVVASVWNKITALTQGDQPDQTEREK